MRPPSVSPATVLTSVSQQSVRRLRRSRHQQHSHFFCVQKQSWKFLKYNPPKKESVFWVDNCPPKCSDKETEESSRGVGFKNTGYSTINESKKKTPTWSRCLHVKHARVSDADPSDSHAKTYFLFVRKNKKNKRPHGFSFTAQSSSQQTTGLSVRCARAKTFKKVLFSPSPPPPRLHPYSLLIRPDSRRENSSSSVRLHASRRRVLTAGHWSATERITTRGGEGDEGVGWRRHAESRDLWRNSLAFQEAEVLASCAITLTQFFFIYFFSLLLSF